MFSIKALLFAVFCIVATTATTFRPCEKGNVPSELRVKGCDAEPCTFYHGEEVTAEWDFTVVKDTDNLKPVVKATAYGVTVNYPLPQQNACKSLTNGECPLDKDELVTYGLNMPILNIYPKITVKLEFSLVDKDENVHSCFKLNAKISSR